MIMTGPNFSYIFFAAPHAESLLLAAISPDYPRLGVDGFLFCKFQSVIAREIRNPLNMKPSLSPIHVCIFHGKGIMIKFFWLLP